MFEDRRQLYELQTRKKAVKLFQEGLGYKAVARLLKISASAVQSWLCQYQAVGIVEFLAMKTKHTNYSYEVKLAVAKAIVDGETSRTEVMKSFHVVSLARVKAWCHQYREGGPQALLPKHKGRPKGSLSIPKTVTREQALEQENLRLRAEIAVLKKSIALKASMRLATHKRR